ncbi:carboxypeptidase-like regulatory domain-containing protein [Sulfurovum sp. XTW-4]|uniref:Carboxypeptidase-like regulatory domain-containing protein n=1 Tax=Sulfurovum xiamenensis TaxID=3019066 RepID=A0ABT7QPG0_9BACT|nr:carboxypeptidase-like regulatory domain-containing protein [Sulfurovum xiamenensis]MDM5262948.1 carboxypeptidase-like regulatory domain-containing protein [Sulfurovum xiamenensis]
MKKSVLYKGLILTLFVLAVGSQTIADAPSSNYDDPKYTGDIVGQIDTCLVLGSNEGVRIYIPGSSFEAITGSVGNFKMSHVQSGTYNLTVTQNGHHIGTIPKVTVVPKQINNIGTVTFCLNNNGNDLYEQ